MDLYCIWEEIGENFDNKRLSLYDQNFSHIKDIVKINKLSITPFGLATNDVDRIYISQMHHVLMTDLEFNYIGQYDKVTNAHFILFQNDYLYVCDGNNRSVIKLSSNLKISTEFHFEFIPVAINIINNLACIRTLTSSFYFCDLTDFKIKYKYSNRSCCGVFDNSFLFLNKCNNKTESNGNDMVIDFFNKNGLQKDSISINHLKCSTTKTTIYSFFKKNNENKIFVHLYENKIFII
jgi:hypothetical protein